MSGVTTPYFLVAHARPPVLRMRTSLARERSPDIEPERMAFGRRIARADGFDRAHHAAVALEQAVGDRDDARIRLRGARGAPDVPGDLHFIALAD